MFEAGDHVGGHTHTHEVEHEGRHLAVDTGFIVFNDRTYPNFMALLDELGVAVQASEMSFSVQYDATGLEYNGTTLNSLFAQRRNLLRPSFWRMIRDILRFNREAPALLDRRGQRSFARRLPRRTATHRSSSSTTSCRWAPRSGAPARPPCAVFRRDYFVRFFHNHGMLSVNDRPQWRTIRGGSARYVEQLTAPFRERIRLRTPVESVRRTAAGVIVKAVGASPNASTASSSPATATRRCACSQIRRHAEREVLGAIRYQRNDAVLHTDTALLPRRRLAWAAWNYHGSTVSRSASPSPTT